MVLDTGTHVGCGSHKRNLGTIQPRFGILGTSVSRRCPSVSDPENPLGPPFLWAQFQEPSQLLLAAGWGFPSQVRRGEQLDTLGSPCI